MKNATRGPALMRQRLAINFFAPRASVRLVKICQIDKVRGRVPGTIHGTRQMRYEIEGRRFGSLAVCAVEGFAQDLRLRHMTFARDAL